MQPNTHQKSSLIKWTLLLALVVFYVLVRLMTIFSPEVSRWSLAVDEMPTGNITHDLGQDLLLQLPLYQFKPFAAGTLIEGLVAYPFVKMFGPNLLSLKSAAIVFGLLTMILWFLLLWKYVGKAAAVFAGLLFTFAPMGYVNLTSTAWGNHAESSVFAAASIFCLFWAYFDRNPARAAPALPILLAGLIAGFGIYFSYTGVSWAVFGLILILVVGGTVQWRGPIWYYLGGVAAGMLPLVFSLRVYGLRALGRIDTYAGYSSGSLITADNLFLESAWKFVPLKFFSAFTRDIPRSFCFPSFIGWEGRLWGNLLYGLIGLSLLGFLFFERKPIVALLGRLFSGKKSREDVSTLLLLAVPGFVIWFFLIYSVSGFRVISPSHPHPGNYMAFRYFAPIFPFLFALFGIGVQAIFNAVKHRRFGKFVVMIPFVISMVVLFQMSLALKIAPKDFQVLNIRSDYYSLIVERVAMEMSKHEHKFVGKLEWVERIPPSFRALFYENLAFINPSSFGLSRLLAKSQESIAPMTSHSYRGYGLYVGRQKVKETQGRPIEAIQAILESHPDFEGKNRQAFLEGAGESFFFAMEPYIGKKWHQVTLVKMDAIWNTVASPEDRFSLLAGIGRGIGANFELNDLGDLVAEPGFWVGVGRQLRRNAHIQLLRNDLAIEAIESFPKSAKPWVLTGWKLEQEEVFEAYQGR